MKAPHLVPSIPELAVVVSGQDHHGGAFWRLVAACWGVSGAGAWHGVPGVQQDPGAGGG